MTHQEFKALGHAVTTSDLEAIVFGLPLRHVREMRFESDEVTAVCPITGQPDQYTVVITFESSTRSLESKSLKLYLQKFRNEGVFAEELADQICSEVLAALKRENIRSLDVTVVQKRRGGIELTVNAAYTQ